MKLTSKLKKYYIAWFFRLDRWKKRLLLIGLDSFLGIIAFFLALFMRLGTTDFFYNTKTYIGCLLAIFITLSVFIILGLYNNFTRHISIQSIFNIAVSSALSGILLFLAILLFGIKLPLFVTLIYTTLLYSLVSAVRFLISYLGQNISNEKKENIAIYGAGTTAIQLMESLRHNRNYRVKLFIDDNTELDGKNLGGVQILNFDHAKKKIQSLEIKTLLISMPNQINVVRKQVFDIISDYPLKVKIIPSISSLISGKFEINQLKDIKIEDLLGRDPVDYNSQLMGKNITKKTILITGAGGSVGSELCRQIILLKPKKLIMMDVSELAIYNLLEELKLYTSIHEQDLVPLIGSVQDKQFIKKIFNRFTIDTIYHAAAYKHVPLMEQNVIQCIGNNVFGTLNMAELASAANVKHFTLVSTDKAVNPTSFMGASKRLSEIICQTLSHKKKETCFSIVRFGNVLGSSGSVVPLFKKQIEKGGPVTLTHIDMTRYFMTISEAAQLVIQAGSIAKGGDVFVLDMGKSIKILDLAKRMITLMGRRPIVNSSKKQREDEIAITISGLRPGEKLFEELTYNTNLIGTDHPRINTTNEKTMEYKELMELLATVRNAINEGNHKILYKTIAKIANGVCNFESSTDVFIKHGKVEPVKVVPLQLNKKG